MAVDGRYIRAPSWKTGGLPIMFNVTTTGSEEVLFLQPTILPKRLQMLRRSRCVQIFL